MNQATSARENTIIASEKEQIIMTWNSLISSKTLGEFTNIDEDKFETELNNNGASTKVNYVDSEQDKYFSIIFINTNHKYILDQNGVITSKDTISIESTDETTKYMVTFNPNGGILENNIKYFEEGDKLGQLPIPTMTNVEFKGWYTKDGEIVTENTLMENRDITYYARWMKNLDNSSSLEETIQLIQTSEIPFEIKVNNDIKDNIIIPKDTNILLNLQNYTLKNTSNANIINNNGTLEIINGTIESTAGNYATIDNNGSGTIVVKDSIIISNNKQTICNKGGTIYIEGESSIISKNAYTIDNRSRNSLHY